MSSAPAREDDLKRGFRGAVVGTLAWLSVVVAHTLAGGALPSVGTTAVCTTVAVVAGTAFAGRRLTWPRAVLALLVLQPLLHTTLVTLAVGHHGHAHPIEASWPMIWAHIAATMLGSAWLAEGDRLLTALVSSVRRWRRPQWFQQAPARAVQVLAASAGRVRAGLDVVRDGTGLRGPPVPRLA